jgi:hypothetical protein
MNYSHRKLSGEFTLGMVCLILGIGLLGFCMYLLPYMLINLHYSVPTFVVAIQAYLAEHHGIHGVWQIWLVLLPLALTGCMFLYLAREYTLTIADEEALDQAKNNSSSSVSSSRYYRKKYTIHPMIAILSLLLLVLVLVLVVQWLLGVI